MPFYRCFVPKDATSYKQREKIAIAFTDVHCGLSTAPQNLMQVAFLESNGSGVVADSHGQGVLRYDAPYFVAGGNRAGRSPEVKRWILEGLLDRLSEIAGVSKDLVNDHISEAPVSWATEAGTILPDPGKEPQEWYEKRSAPS